jgi:hypothetical protein
MAGGWQVRGEGRWMGGGRKVDGRWLWRVCGYIVSKLQSGRRCETRHAEAEPFRDEVMWL